MLDAIRARRCRDGGFTTAELAIAVVVCGALLAVAIPLYLNYTLHEDDTTSPPDLRNVISVLQTCYSEHGHFPAGSGRIAIAFGGSKTFNDCETHTIVVSKGTTMYYYAATATPASYVLVSRNSRSNRQLACYDSTRPGSIVAVSANSPVAC